MTVAPTRVKAIKGEESKNIFIPYLQVVCLVKNSYVRRMELWRQLRLWLWSPGRWQEWRKVIWELEGKVKCEWTRSHWGRCNLEDETTQTNFLGYTEFKAQTRSKNRAIIQNQKDRKENKTALKQRKKRISRNKESSTRSTTKEWLSRSRNEKFVHKSGN